MQYFETVEERVDKEEISSISKKSNNFGKTQHAKKVVSDSTGLVDFTIGLLYSVFSS